MIFISKLLSYLLNYVLRQPLRHQTDQLLYIMVPKVYVRDRPSTHPAGKNPSKISSGSTVLSRQTRDDGSVQKPKNQTNKMTQIHFKVSNTAKLTCTSCNMSYIPHLKADSEFHAKFHQRALAGREWLPNWGKTLYTKRIKIGNENKLATLKEVDITNKAEVKAANEILALVNTELQAPNDCGAWLRGPEFGKVFVCIVEKRAIGLVCLERVHKGEWMILETGKIVPNQTVKLVCGISRIYVSRKYRRCHIGTELLHCTTKNFVYALELPISEIGWSQPSEFGSKLAKNFNSMKHKTGCHLLPIYIEEEGQDPSKKGAPH